MGDNDCDAPTCGMRHPWGVLCTLPEGHTGTLVPRSGGAPEVYHEGTTRYPGLNPFQWFDHPLQESRAERERAAKRRASLGGSTRGGPRGAT